MCRERQELRQGKVVDESKEYSFYLSSFTTQERSAKEMAQYIRGHWDACENGSHYRRDVTLNEDASKVTGRGAAQAMATLRNLVIGLFELQQDKGRANAPNLPGWRRRMTATKALGLIKKGA